MDSQRLRYNTRNNLAVFDVGIDFDEASAEWRRNKKALSNGMFSYVCGVNTKSGKPCQRAESHRRFHKNDTENSDK